MLQHHLTLTWIFTGFAHLGNFLGAGYMNFQISYTAATKILRACACKGICCQGFQDEDDENPDEYFFLENDHQTFFFNPELLKHLLLKDVDMILVSPV